jgi:hypothetical protein
MEDKSGWAGGGLENQSCLGMAFDSSVFRI